MGFPWPALAENDAEPFHATLDVVGKCLSVSHSISLVLKNQHSDPWSLKVPTQAKHGWMSVMRGFADRPSDLDRLFLRAAAEESKGDMQVGSRDEPYLGHFGEFVLLP
jgi:hypothetical protein